MRLISPKIISFYFQCPRKASLLFQSDEKYKMTDYEALIANAKEKVKTVYFNNEAVNYKDGLLAQGIPLIKNSRISLDHYEFNCNLLIKKEGKSSLGNFIYEPGIFLSDKNILKQDRMELAFLGLSLEIIQGEYPQKAVFINNTGGQHRINIKILKNEVEEAVESILGFKERDPKLILNKYCNQCSFQQLCKAKAIKEDNLTLLNRMTEKQVNKLEKKGIFTLKQLSFVYKPRKRSKRVKNPVDIYKPELQALAIRTEKTYIQNLPTLQRKPLEIFLDIESIPSEHFYYLFGLIISENEKKLYRSFWSDFLEDEEANWLKVISILEIYPESPIYHYGSYESSVFDLLSKKYNTNIEKLKSRLSNINTSIFGKIYFPTYSNGLKEIGQALGMKWRNENATGLQSIVWRKYWEEGQEKYKDIILSYNEDDCVALEMLTNELTRIKMLAEKSDDIEFVQEPKKVSSEKGQNIHNQFDLVLKLAHHEYNRKKIKVDLIKNEIKKVKEKVKSRKGYTWLGKKIRKPNKTVVFPADEYCFKHPDRKLTKSKLKSKRVMVDLVFGKNGVRKTIIEYIGNQGECPICHFSNAPILFRQMSKDLYGHNYKAWVVFQRVEIQLSFSKINQCLYELIKDKIGISSGGLFIKDFSEHYKETEDEIIEYILKSPFIHVDETTVNINGEKQYVWIFTTDKYVTLKLTKGRDAVTVKDFLKEYDGVLISDFFAGYDSVDCKQQKCWVHLIRDLNNDLWKNPFDEEYEKVVSEIRNLIIPIIQSTYLHGLKKHFLSKYQKNVDNYYKKVIDGKSYKSELCQKFQKRFKRYRNSLFTFIIMDGINWHNNAAENGIRHICVQRKISGYFGEYQFPHYLRMVSILQTCKLQDKSFFKFLLSKEKDISKFR